MLRLVVPPILKPAMVAVAWVVGPVRAWLVLAFVGALGSWSPLGFGRRGLRPSGVVAATVGMIASCLQGERFPVKAKTGEENVIAASLGTSSFSRLYTLVTPVALRAMATYGVSYAVCAVFLP